MGSSERGVAARGCLVEFLFLNGNKDRLFLVWERLLVRVQGRDAGEETADRETSLINTHSPYTDRAWTLIQTQVRGQNSGTGREAEVMTGPCGIPLLLVSIFSEKQDMRSSAESEEGEEVTEVLRREEKVGGRMDQGKMKGSPAAPKSHLRTLVQQLKTRAVSQVVGFPFLSTVQLQGTEAGQVGAWAPKGECMQGDYIGEL